MNPLTNVKNIKKLSEEELKGKNRTSWHDQYRGSAWVFVGGLPYELTEGDIICVFSQYGEPVNLNLVRDKETGKSKGFCFICFEDQRSTDLAVDNFNGIKVLGRTIRVDHVENYKPPKTNKDEKLEAVQKERGNKKKFSNSDTSSNEANEKIHDLKQRRKKRRENEFDADERSGKKSRKKVLKLHKKRRKLESEVRGNSESEIKKEKKGKERLSDSDSLSSSSSSSSSSTTTTSSDEDDDNIYKKNKSKKNYKCQKFKRGRTIEDLKREARLIHAELKRRQRMEEQDKRVRPHTDEKQHRKRDQRHAEGRGSAETNKDGRHGNPRE